MCVQGTGLTLTLKTLHVCHMPSHSLNKLLAAMTNLEYELLLIYTNCTISAIIHDCHFHTSGSLRFLSFEGQNSPLFVS